MLSGFFNRCAARLIGCWRLRATLHGHGPVARAPARSWPRSPGLARRGAAPFLPARLGVRRHVGTRRTEEVLPWPRLLRTHLAHLARHAHTPVNLRRDLGSDAAAPMRLLPAVPHTASVHSCCTPGALLHYLELVLRVTRHRCGYVKIRVVIWGPAPCSPCSARWPLGRRMLLGEFARPLGLLLLLALPAVTAGSSAAATSD